MSFGPVLYAEDEENDAFFLKRAFKRSQIQNPLIVVSDGQAAIDYCAETSNSPNRIQDPLPALVLLDLKMPKKSGIEVLDWLRRQALLSRLPVIILTSSTQEEDIRQAYNRGANAYLIKPSDPDVLKMMVKGVCDFWLKPQSL